MKKWLANAIEREKTWWGKNWIWFALLGVLAIVVVLTACDTTRSYGPLPAMDANQDGVVDTAYKDAVAAGGTIANTATGGMFSLWIQLATQVLLAGSAAYVAHKRGSKDHSQNVDRITQLELEIARLRASGKI